ncbi:GntR family transcriptional regulator [Crenobacter intestini]|uniref:GntR family transcriptional regulator n=1 Tax=Crenobacter intestini TaxID=2563443 RepID=A0A4T0UTC6_9NEIS|nr:GntR family transcriptional regulator [Crenobacter intestini]TIC82108.1 GntR family transcriptional regulator [Crenobacter intestini]
MGKRAGVVSREPLYRQVRTLLLERVCEGEWDGGEPLPSEWELAAQLSVSQGTVRKALGEMVADGVLERVQGKGTFVAPPESDWGHARLVSPVLVGESPDPLSRELLGVARVAASEEVAEVLGLRRHAALHQLRFLWRRGGEAVALDEVLLSAERFEGVDARTLRSRSLGVAQLVARFGVRVKPALAQYRVQTLAREDAALFGVGAGMPALSVLELFDDTEGRRTVWRQRLCLTERLAYTVGV